MGSQFSLQGEIKKRKTQEIERVIEDRRIATARGEGQPSNPSTIARTPDQRRTTQTMRTVHQPSNPSSIPRAEQTSGQSSVARRTQTQTMQAVVASPSSLNHVNRLTTKQLYAIIGTAGVTLIILLILAVAVMSTAQPDANPGKALAQLPMVRAQDVLEQFKNAGLAIAKVRTQTDSVQGWNADEVFQFEVQKDNQKGSFILLSYTDEQDKVPDMFRAKTSQTLSTWQRMTESNIVILNSPDTPQTIRADIGTQLMKYLVIPYRPIFTDAKGSQ